MCIEIRYAFLNCNHLSHIGRYTCYAAQQQGNGFDEKCEKFKVTDQKIKNTRGKACAVCTERRAEGTVIEAKAELELEGETEVSEEELGEKNKEQVERLSDEEDEVTGKGSWDRGKKGDKAQKKVVKKNRKDDKKPKIGLLAMFD